MKVNIIMPKMGESLNEGTIIKWHKSIGDIVKKDEIIFEITTDKVDTEIPSPAEGILSEILVNEQETVAVDTIVAVIDSDLKIDLDNKEKNKVEPVINKIETSATDRILKVNSKELTPENKTLEKSSIENLKSNNTQTDFYSPVVLNLAQRENISFDELKKIVGTGADGRVTKKDVLNYIGASGIDKIKEDVSVSKYQKEVKADDEFDIHWQEGENSKTVPMDNIRQKIMKHMQHSRDTSVHVVEVIEADMTRIHNFIKNNKENFYRKENIKLTYMPFFALACINALKEHPLVNSSIVDDNIVLKRHINLGIAVALKPNGLIVPNIKDAEEKSFKKIANEIALLSEKAKTKQLTIDDITGGTFTISNYGVFGTLFGTPIINQPEVAILGVGAVIKKPVVIEVDGMDSISIKPMMYLALSHDHRLVDGMLGGKFLKSIKDYLENFETTLI